MTNEASTLVDSCVLLDVLTTDPEWEPWSSAARADVLDAGPVIINPIVCAEVSTGFAGIEEVDEALPTSTVQREDLPWPAGLLAAKAFLAYRSRGGVGSTPMADFYIGAHALVRGHRLLTQDTARCRTSCPRLELVAPR